MKFTFFGSSTFAALILENLFSNDIVPSLIVSNPDAPRGRGLKVLPTLASEFAKQKNIPLYNPVSLKSPETHEFLRMQDADFFVVADYGKILPASIIMIPKIFGLAIHPSLLPRYRGPAPINWVLIKGEKQTGITIFRLNDKIDDGDIISQAALAIEEKDNVSSLMKKLADLGALQLIETFKKIKEGNYTLAPQEQRLASYDPKLKKEDGKINWHKPAIEINNLIRGTYGWPSAYTLYKGKIVKILEAASIEEDFDYLPSKVIRFENNAIFVATASGILKITKLKPEGKKDMDAGAFISGYRIAVGDNFE